MIDCLGACIHCYRHSENTVQDKAQTRTYLWGIGSVSIFRHASINIGVSGRFAIEARIDFWVVIPLIPHEAFPSHLPSLDVDPAADDAPVRDDSHMHVKL